MKREKQIKFRVTNNEYIFLKSMASLYGYKVPKFIYTFLMDKLELTLPLKKKYLLSDKSEENIKFTLYLTCNQYKQVKEDSNYFGINMSDLVKKIYFGKDLLQKKISKSTETKIIYEINKAGNNLNQIAKKLNEGKKSQDSERIKEIQKSIEEIRTWTMS